ncbi:MAG TPA: hypothetical protein VFT32_01495 [Candidatus Eisenbacteria bacterium]|nr:hypothetical protein [Candidatus Eisenbacteria bacterium]
MTTLDEDLDWGHLREAAERGGAREVARVVFQRDAESRRGLWRLALRRFDDRESPLRNFELLIDIAQAGIDDSMTLANQAETAESAAEWADAANVLSYNLSAALADCWPDDPAPRERHHFEIGLRAAEDCVRWRWELAKPADRRAMAYWAAGMHHLSLGHLAEAWGGFSTAERLVRGEGKGGHGAGVTPGGDFGVILYHGYAGIARWLMGDDEGRRDFERACRAFEETYTRDTERKEDAQFGLEQLRWVEKKFIAAVKG